MARTYDTIIWRLDDMSPEELDDAWRDYSATLSAVRARRVTVWLRNRIAPVVLFVFFMLLATTGFRGWFGEKGDPSTGSIAIALLVFAAVLWLFGTHSALDKKLRTWKVEEQDLSDQLGMHQLTVEKLRERLRRQRQPNEALLQPGVGPTGSDIPTVKRSGTTLPLKEVAGSFIVDTFEENKREWPATRGELRTLFPESFIVDDGDLDDEVAEFHFGLARIAVEMQALRNLLPAALARRIRGDILTILGSQDGKASSSALFVIGIDDAWSAALASDSNPMTSAGIALYRALELEQEIEIDGVPFASPTAVAMLTGLALSQVGWWRRYLANHSLHEGD